MAKVTYGSKWGRVRSRAAGEKSASVRSPEEVVRDLKKAQAKPPGEDYRERSLAIHGLVCARCGRSFEGMDRRLLTVHHKDGNHSNNPADGSNWENLCVYCHEDAHSRELLGDYLEGAPGGRDYGVAYEEERGAGDGGLGSLGDKLKKALLEKSGKSKET